jgi:cytochrome c biogenesis protein CcdA
MTLLILSFLAGVLTVAAPCTITLLPVIVGGSLARSEKSEENSWKRPLIIALSLGLSVILFTLLLKASTALLGVPAMAWQLLAGIIISALGLSLVFPSLWEKISIRTGLFTKSNKFLGKSYKREGTAGDVLTGLALGPVFSSCNPTYAFVVASVLPRSFTEGFLYLIAYTIGLSGVLLLISYLGQSFIQKLGWLQDPEGKFKKIVGIIFILVGMTVVFGYDKKAETFIIDRGLYDPVSNFEQSLR